MSIKAEGLLFYKKQRTQNRSMSMKRFSVLLLAIYWGLLEAQVSKNNDGTNRLTSMSQEERPNPGSPGEKFGVQ